MELQKTSRKSYAEELRNSIEDNIGRYLQDNFDFDDAQTLYVPNVEHPTGLLGKMLNAPDECRAAKALYESYRHLTPIQASQPAFWVYLAHAELFPYVKKRWSKLAEKPNKEQYILDHWFFSKGILHQALSSLWWLVYLSIDEDASDEEKYRYTDFLFSNYTLRIVRLGPTKLMRHKEAVIGMISYLMDTKDATDANNSMEDRVNFVVSHFNMIGGAKQLVSLNRDFFYNELEKVRHEFMNYKHKQATETEDWD